MLRPKVIDRSADEANRTGKAGQAGRPIAVRGDGRRSSSRLIRFQGVEDSQKIKLTKVSVMRIDRVHTVLKHQHR